MYEYLYTAVTTVKAARGSPPETPLVRLIGPDVLLGGNRCKTCKRPNTAPSWEATTSPKKRYPHLNDRESSRPTPSRTVCQPQSYRKRLAARDAARSALSTFRPGPMHSKEKARARAGRRAIGRQGLTYSEAAAASWRGVIHFR